ncbi:hypothetical protein BAE44_0013402 [Dichanthelium oligosanthes]|uniref:HMA domain-containing protein n=1 Tax=Dichanthelium oligosanthes TaxID=888268 RepID=A0A1E5VKF2_9POAL|nr:hypothetical protein BAE44_0013402 [Dichanthelium oligosanthes]
MASLMRWKDKYVKERLQGLSGLSCSSAASTSVVVSSGRAIDRHSPRLRDPHRRLPPSVPRPQSSPYSTTKDSYDDDASKDKRKKKSAEAAAAGGSSLTSSEHKKNKKKQAVQLQQVSPASSSRFLLNSSRLMMQSDDDIITVVDSLPPPLPSSPQRPLFIDDDDSLPPLPSPRPAFIDDDDIFPGRGDAALQLAAPSGLQLQALPVELLAEPPSAGAGSSASSWSSSETGRRAAAGDKTAMMRSCSTRTGQHQVVVLRVSLHCKGCAGKVKKHISKMEGVTSFDIDIPTKKVTVVGDVTPLGVLNSISKVKSAQFWPDAALSSLSTPPRASASF